MDNQINIDSDSCDTDDDIINTQSGLSCYKNKVYHRRSSINPYQKTVDDIICLEEGESLGVKRKAVQSVEVRKSYDKQVKPNTISTANRSLVTEVIDLEWDDDNDSIDASTSSYDRKIQGVDALSEDIINDVRKTKPLPKHRPTAAVKSSKQSPQKPSSKGKPKQNADVTKAIKKAETMTNKENTNDKCFQNITVVMDNELVAQDGSAILKPIEELKANYSLKQLPVSSSFGWQRRNLSYVVDGDANIVQNVSYNEENYVGIVITATRFVAKVASQKEGTTDDHASESLLNYIRTLQKMHQGKEILLIVQGMENYFKSVKLSEKQAFRATVSQKTSKSKQSSHIKVSKVDVEVAVLEAQLELNCSVVFCEKAEELGLLIGGYTKAIAEKPFKRQNPSQWNFFAIGCEKNSAIVNNDGVGLLEVWTRQLQQFKNVSHETAASITSLYKSPQSLIKAYAKCRNNNEAAALLQDIEVRRGHGMLATSRRVGQDLSKRIHHFMVSTNPLEEAGK